MKRHLLSAAALLLVASMAQAESTKSSAKGAAKAPVLSAGIALEYVEPKVRAQDVFFEYLNGKWLKTVEIPADKSSWGAFHKLHDDTQPQLRAIIEKSAAAKGAKEIGDRKAAITEAVKGLASGDVLLIAGKGHEDYQIVGTTKTHFSDHETVAEAIKG